MSADNPLTIISPRFGQVELCTEQLIEFEGLPGFDELRRFVVLKHESDSPFGWLLSVERPELSFLVADPRRFFPTYHPELGPAQLQALDASEPDELELLAIGRFEDGTLSFNLAAPVIVNFETRRGVQTILETGGWSTREPVPHM